MSDAISSDRLEKGLAKLDDDAADRLRTLVLESPEQELFHIDVMKTSREWERPRREVIDIFLQAVACELCTLEWVFHCPDCGGVARESLNLAHTHEQDFCPVCKVDFRNTLDDNVEIFFSVSSEIRVLSDELRAAYEKRIVDDITSEGVHRWRSESTVNGVEVLTHPVFRRLFGDDTLSLDQSLEIRSATILFTDVTGSTAMYERLGDARAYRLIRDQFNLVFDAIAEFDGLPIKTIGDAVMGVFTNEVSAIEAAFAMDAALERYDTERSDNESIHLKVGLHRGAVIAVTLNGRIDYFGRTVNIAARTQQTSTPRHVALLPEVLEAPGVKAAIRAHGIRRIGRGTTHLKGIDGPVTYYRVPLARR